MNRTEYQFTFQDEPYVFTAKNKKIAAVLSHLIMNRPGYQLSNPPGDDTPLQPTLSEIISEDVDTFIGDNQLNLKRAAASVIIKRDGYDLVWGEALKTQDLLERMALASSFTYGKFGMMVKPTPYNILNHYLKS